MNYTLTLGNRPDGSPIAWKDAPNSNIAISGMSGQGKTFLICQISQQLAKQGVHCVHIDIAGELGDQGKPAGWPPAGTRYLSVCSKAVPVTTFHLESIGNGQQENPTFAACRIAGILKDALRLGPVQAGYLAACLESEFSCGQEVDLASITERIEMNAEENIRAAVALQGRFLGFKPFPKASPDCYAAYGTPGVTVINAQEITLSSLRKPVSELIMANLWSYKTRHPKSCPLVFFLDECQNLRFDADSMAQRILREGRKYDIAGCFSTQWIPNVQDHPLNGAALQIHFCPEDRGLQSAATMLTQKDPGKRKACMRELARLTPGQFIYRGKQGPVFVDGRTSL